MVLSLPRTRLGWWSVGLAGAFVVLLVFGIVLEVLLPVRVPEGLVRPYGIMWLASGLSGGVVGLFALLRGQEHSALVWLAMVPGLAALVFLIGEVLGRW